MERAEGVVNDVGWWTCVGCLIGVAATFGGGLMVWGIGFMMQVVRTIGIQKKNGMQSVVSRGNTMLVNDVERGEVV